MNECCAKWRDLEEEEVRYGGIEQQPDGSWNVFGCCGGNCYVVTGMRFCPFCGKALPSIVSAETAANA